MTTLARRSKFLTLFVQMLAMFFFCLSLPAQTIRLELINPMQSI